MMAIQPLTWLIGKIKLPCKHEVTETDVETLLNLMQPGDILVSKTHQNLSNIFIPGFYKHAAIVSSYATIVEAVDPCVQEVIAKKWIEDHCYVVLLRDESLSPEQRWRLTTESKKFLKYPYDYQLWPGNKDLYCIELVRAAFIAAFGKNPIPSRKVWGVDTMYPDDARYSKDFTVMYKSTGAK
jgi:uncharacterized protein YycO